MNQEAKTIIKISALGIIGGALSLTSFYLLNQFFATLNFNLAFLLLASIFLFIVSFVLQVFFVDELPTLVVFSFIQSALATVVFLPYYDGSRIALYFLVGSFAVLTFFLIVAAKEGRSSLENSLKVKFLSVAHSVAPKVIAGSLIFMALISYFYFFQMNNFSRSVGHNLFSKAMQSIEPAFQIWFPGVEFDMTMAIAIEEISKTQLERSKIDLLKQGINVDDLPPSVKNRLLQGVEERVIQALEGFGGEVDMNETFETYLFKTIEGWINSLSSNIQLAVQVGSVVLIYLILKTFSFAIYFPAEVLAFLLVKLLLLVNFGEIVLEEVSKESIRI